MMVAERKYVLTRIKAGDYLLPSNDRKTIWRIAKYVDGPSQGLEIPADRDFWGLWKYNAPTESFGTAAVDDWSCWSLWDDLLDTRREAIDSAMKEDTP